MKKTITIDGIEIEMKASALTPYLFKEKFGGDLLTEMQNISNVAKDGRVSESVIDPLQKCAYIMAKQANQDLTDEYDEWLDQFSMFGIIQAMPQITELWGNNLKGTSVSKKK